VRAVVAAAGVAGAARVLPRTSRAPQASVALADAEEHHVQSPNLSAGHVEQGTRDDRKCGTDG
jgi:hypothetical protein